jgi:glucosamine--fructose-6-phosphate aminotransferase (isomerizing)
VRLVEQPETQAVGRALAERGVRTVRLVGHGSSDAAASYGVYAFGLLPGWTALRDSISLTVYYDAALDLRSSAVIALSQSGQTPDVVEYATRARGRGALTIAVTNEEGSALADVCDLTLPLAAGPERAVAASKTYLNSVAALLLMAGFAAGRADEVADGVRATASLLDETMPPLAGDAARIATAFAYVGRMYVIGRGLEYSTAREIALKLTETCRIAAEPLTATDLVHGPIAAVDSLVPVWTIASRDPTLHAVKDAAERARGAGGVLVASGSAAAEIHGAPYRLPVPEAPVPLYAPLLSVVAGQLFSAALARQRGFDADRPERLTKVTLAP